MAMSPQDLDGYFKATRLVFSVAHRRGKGAGESFDVGSAFLFRPQHKHW